MAKANKKQYLSVSTVPFTRRDVFALRLACAMVSNAQVAKLNWIQRLIQPLLGPKKQNICPSPAALAVVEADKLLAELAKPTQA